MTLPNRLTNGTIAYLFGHDVPADKRQCPVCLAWLTGSDVCCVHSQCGNVCHAKCLDESIVSQQDQGLVATCLFCRRPIGLNERSMRQEAKLLTWWHRQPYKASKYKYNLRWNEIEQICGLGEIDFKVEESHVLTADNVAIVNHDPHLEGLNGESLVFDDPVITGPNIVVGEWKLRWYFTKSSKTVIKAFVYLPPRGLGRGFWLQDKIWVYYIGESSLTVADFRPFWVPVEPVAHPF